MIQKISKRAQIPLVINNKLEYSFTFQFMIMKIQQFFIYIIVLMISGVAAQNRTNFKYPMYEIEEILKFDSIVVLSKEKIPNLNWESYKVWIKLDNSDSMKVKLKPTPFPGFRPNNEPQYELAAYEFQKFFLDTNEYVVPPTICRALSLKQYNEVFSSKYSSTLSTPSCVIFELQYWLSNVNEFTFDMKRFDTDEKYARAVAIMNIFTYLINHKDSNKGNFLISKDTLNPRIFVVDNGLILSSLYGRFGYYWKNLRVKKVPKDIIEKLRIINSDSLHSQLGVVTQFKIQKDTLALCKHSKNMNPILKLRQNKKQLQYGLTKGEIRGIEKRLKSLLKKVDKKEILLF